MKKVVIFCLVGIAILLSTACEFNPLNTVTVSGSNKTITREANNTSATYAIVFDGLQFTNSNVTINIEPVAASEKARVEVTYSEAFDHYGFYATINDGSILVGADSHYQYDIDTFSMTIYASFDEVDVEGGGYKTLINATGISSLDIDASGAADCNVSSLESSLLTINASGASNFTLSGTTTNAEIDTSGSSDTDAKYLTCDSVNIKTSGASDLVISVKDSLKVNASGASDIRYYGSPTVTVDASGASSVRKISSDIPA